MPNRLALCACVSMLTALSGCLSGTFGGEAEPAPEGVVALGDGLVGQIKGVRLRGDAKAKAVDAEFQALQFAPAGKEVVWSEGKWQGQVMPTQLYRIGSQDCRGFTHTLLEGGKSWKQTGTACRDESGTWKIVV
jgi:surface antigen